MSRILGLPPVAREQFSNPPLKAILGQVRFPAVAEIGEPPLRRLEDDYPKLASEQQIGVGLDADGAPRRTESLQWRLASEDGAWSVVVGADFVSLEAAKPQDVRYAEFRDRFGAAWRAALDELRPGRRLQLGLRYINHLAGGADYDWTRSINRELLGFLAPLERQEALEVAVNNWVFAVPHGLLAVKHGVVRAGERDELGYLLDFDYVTQQDQEQLEVEPVVARLDEFHDAISTLFRWCVTDEAAASFRGR